MDLGLKGKDRAGDGRGARRRPRDRAQPWRPKARASPSTIAARRKEAEALVAEIAAQGRKGESLSGGCRGLRRRQGDGRRHRQGFRRPQILVNNAGLALRQRFRRDQARGLAPPDRYLSLRRDPLLPRRGAASRRRQRTAASSACIGDSSRVGESGLAIVAAARAGVIALDEIAGARVRPLRHHRECRVARPGRDARTTRIGSMPTAKSCVKLYPVRRLGMPDDIAPMVALLASPHGGWITGQVHQHQRRLQHGLTQEQREVNDAAHRPDRADSGIAAPACRGARRQGRLSRCERVGDLCGTARSHRRSSPAISPISGSARRNGRDHAAEFGAMGRKLLRDRARRRRQRADQL